MIATTKDTTKEELNKRLISIDKRLTTILLILEIPTRNMGYFYSKECAKIICINPVARFQMNELVFKVLAEKYNTTSARIERSIRHLLSTAASSRCFCKLEKILNIPVTFNMIHPNVCEFLCLLAECVNFVEG